MGIEEKNLKCIFKPFSQVLMYDHAHLFSTDHMSSMLPQISQNESHLSRKHGGTGLGNVATSLELSIELQHNI